MAHKDMYVNMEYVCTNIETYLYERMYIYVYSCVWRRP